MSEYYDLWVKAAGIVCALGAFWLALRAHYERAAFEMIDRMYSLCHALQAHALKECCVAHLYCIGEEEYALAKARVSQIATKEKVDECLIKEKLFAVHIFVVYEQIYFQWKHSAKWMHPLRRRFLESMLSYFVDRVLQNPRLRHYLDEDPVGASLHLEPESRAYIDKAGKRKAGAQVDKEGPHAQLAGLRQAANELVA